MELPRVTVVAVLLVCVMSRVVIGEVYKVGDKAGWTTMGNVDYKQWAATKTFQVGDVILFEYNSQFHNVMQVNHTEYRSCIVTKPIASYTTGNDSLTVTTLGHHFFMCGVPGHCQSGQKVDINVLRTSVTPSPTVAPKPSATAPAPSGAVPSFVLGSISVKVGICVAAYASFVLGF